MTTNPFGTDAMAAGYAAFRPPLHSLILERVKRRLPFSGKVARALDVGCGAGLSTRALTAMADRCIGIDSAELMLRGASNTAPGAKFIAARAEAIPLRAHSVDLLTAAGSLNYVDLALFFQEAARVLAPGGVVVVYDFSTGRTFRDSGALDRWFSSFVARYPWPPGEALDLDPERLARRAPGFRLQGSDDFEIGIPLTPAFYLEYVLTETNVAFALRGGAHEARIRSWCAGTLGPVWGEQVREVLFRGYFACLTRA